MKWFRDMWNKLNFQNKLLCICLAISLFPVIVLGIFSYSNVRDQLWEREEKIIEDTLQEERVRINNEINSCLTALNQIVLNNNLMDALTKKYEKVSEMYIAYRDDIDPLFLTIRSLHPVINNICIYTDHFIYPHGSILRDLEEINDRSWYSQVVDSPNVIYEVSEDGNTLYMIRKMNIYGHETSIVHMSIDLNKLLGSSHPLFSGNYTCKVVDSENSEIFVKSTLPDNSVNNAIVKSGKLSLMDLSIVIYRPHDEVYAIVRPVLVTCSLVIVLCVLFVVFFSVIFSTKIVAPLRQLTESMALVEKGKYGIRITDIGNDEFGKLVTAFNNMTSKLDSLVNEVLNAEIEKHKYRLKIFQLQLNPHFLYNSLSVINSRAIQRGQDDIGEMARLLSEFYRTMLNKGKFVITLEKEIENVKAYIEIQRIVHRNSFDVVYEVDESLYDCQLPNMILQPLAENAILHGLDYKMTLGKGILAIRCYRDKDDIVIKVIDNGCGMSEHMCQKVLTSQSKGYGVSNVQQRIQLFYGEEYGLRYRSTPQAGTCVEVRVPGQLPQNQID